MRIVKDEGKAVPPPEGVQRNEVAASEVCKLLAADLQSPEYQQGLEELRRRDPKQAIQDFIPLLKVQDATLGAAQAVASLGAEYPSDVFHGLKSLLDEERDEEVLSKMLKAVEAQHDPQAIALLVRMFDEMRNTRLRIRIATALGRFGEPAADFLIKFFKKEKDVKVRRTLVRALGSAKATEAVQLIQDLIKDPDRYTRMAVAAALSELRGDGVLRTLCDALLHEHEQDVIKEFSNAMLAQGRTGEEVVMQFVDLIRTTSVQRADLDEAAIVGAISPAFTGSGGDSLLADKLIEAALDQDERVTSIMAALIVAACQGEPNAAGEKLTVYADRKNVPAEKLERLRIDIGGKTALKPIIGAVEASLTKYFRDPVQDLNERTRKQWQNTIRFAQAGFVLQMFMSFVVFAGGCLLLWTSSTKLLSGELNSTTMWGPGVSFVSGLGSMLLIIYSGPLKQIQRSITDMGSSSAAFIAYVHRVMQISHTFSHYYLQQNIKMEDVSRSCELISDSMRDTVRILQETRDGTSRSEEARDAKSKPGEPEGS